MLPREGDVDHDMMKELSDPLDIVIGDQGGSVVLEEMSHPLLIDAGEFLRGLPPR